MNHRSLIFGIVPLLVFVIIDALADFETGIISAVIFGFVEACYTYYKYKKFDGLTLASFFLFVYLDFFPINLMTLYSLNYNQLF